MELPPKKFIEQLRSIALSHTERSTLRSALIAHMSEHGARQAAPSPWSSFYFAKRIQVVSLSLVIVISYGSSVTFAAEGSLPGDMLYPVKTYVNEPIVRVVTVTSPASEAAFETKLLEKRLEEAETLDAEESFNPELKLSVREGIHEQSIKAKEKINDAENSSGANVSSTTISITGEISTSSPESISEKGDQSHDNLGSDKKNLDNEHPVLRATESVTDAVNISSPENTSGSSGSSNVNSGSSKSDSESSLKDIQQKHKDILEKLDLTFEEGDNDDNETEERRRGE